MQEQNVSQNRAFAEGFDGSQKLVSTTNRIDWPWSGAVRRHIYIDFSVYMVLLVVFCSVTLIPYSRRSRDSYNLVQSIQATLLEEFRPEPDIRFFKINEIGGLKAWIERPMMAVFYGYQPNSMSDESSFKPMASYIPGFYLSSTTILGPIRLRQLRVKANSCLDTLEPLWKASDMITECHAPYGHRAGSLSANSSFNEMWGRFPTQANLTRTMDNFLAAQSQLPLNETMIPVNQTKETIEAAKQAAITGFTFNDHTKAGFYRGRFHSIYREQGFVVDLPENNEQAARTILALLSETEWLDMQTRALFIEFSLYLPSTDLILAARLVAEVHETGTIWTDHMLEPINLETYRTEVEATTRRQLAGYSIGLILVFLCLLWDLRSTWDLRWYQDRRTGATGMWIVVTVALYLTIGAAIGLHVWNMEEAKKLNFVAGEYFSVHRLGYTVQVERGLWSISSFGVWFRLLRFTSQFPYLGILGRTIGKAIPRVFVFVLISSVIFMAFAQCFFIAYYGSVDGYQTYQASIMSVLRFTVMDFDYEAMSNENRLLSPILFFLLLLVVFYIWVNVMVAIISEVYQQEYKTYGCIELDEDYDSMLPDVPQPQNDDEAMHLHFPVHASEHSVQADPIALTPDRFFRMRLTDLDQFKYLVTIDMRQHFVALAESKHKRGRHVPSLPEDPTAPPPTPPGTGHVQFDQGEQPENLGAIAESRRRGHIQSLAEIEIDCEEELRRHSACLMDTQPITEGTFKQNTAGDSLFDLEQHRGIYARMGSLAPPPKLNENQDQVSLGSQESGASSRKPAKKAKVQPQPFELQAIYFERRYHNPTSAKLWWNKHKAVFDSREQLMQHILHSSRKTLIRLGVSTAQNVQKNVLNPLTPVWRTPAGTPLGTPTSWAGANTTQGQEYPGDLTPGGSPASASAPRVD